MSMSVGAASSASPLQKLQQSGSANAPTPFDSVASPGKPPAPPANGIDQSLLESMIGQPISPANLATLLQTQEQSASGDASSKGMGVKLDNGFA
jgi:hypothetical protein